MFIFILIADQNTSHCVWRVCDRHSSERCFLIPSGLIEFCTGMKRKSRVLMFVCASEKQHENAEGVSS